MKTRIFLALVGAVALSACNGSPSAERVVAEESATGNSAIALPAITIKVDDQFNGVGNVNLDIDSDAGDVQVIDQAGAGIAALFKLARDKIAPAKLRFVNIDISVRGARLMHLTYTISQLAAIQGGTPAAALDAADNGGHWSPQNDDLFARWCIDRRASSFCDRISDGLL